MHRTRPAILATLAALCLSASAEARVHRFPPADEVTVSLELRKPGSTGTIVRFARNRIALSRSASGRLVLSAEGSGKRRTMRHDRRRRRLRIRISARTRSATLVAGRRKLRLRGRLLAEDTVVVRSARAVRIRTSAALRSSGRTGAPPATQNEPSPTTVAAKSPPNMGGMPVSSTTPTESTTGAAGVPASSTTPTQSTAGAAGVSAPTFPARLFAAGSVWNAPLRDDAPLDPESGTLVKKLQDTVAQNIADRWGPWIAAVGNTPLYIVPAGQPTVRVKLDRGAWATTLQTAFESVPIPAGAEPAKGPDAHMTVWQPSTDRLWEFFRTSKLTDGWHADFGGAIASVSSYPGYYTTDSWPGLSQWYWGATATSLPVVAGTMRIAELKAGAIPHALAMNIPYARPKVYSRPAQRTDGDSTDPYAIPEGARFRLDPKLDLSELALPPLTRMMAKAAQRYGIIVRDQTHHAVSFFAEDWRQFGTDPYTGKTGFYGSAYPNGVMEAFPWQHLQLLKMELHTQK